MHVELLVLISREEGGMCEVRLLHTGGVVTPSELAPDGGHFVNKKRSACCHVNAGGGGRGLSKVLKDENSNEVCFVYSRLAAPQPYIKGRASE